jgi:hypothetical protein
MYWCNSFLVTKVYNGVITVATFESGHTSSNIEGELVVLEFSDCFGNRNDSTIAELPSKLATR